MCIECDAKIRQAPAGRQVNPSHLSESGYLPYQGTGFNVISGNFRIFRDIIHHKWPYVHIFFGFTIQSHSIVDFLTIPAVVSRAQLAPTAKNIHI